MARHRQARRRASFVVTIALGAGSGCGGGTQSDGNPAACPDSPPGHDSACPSAGLSCDYDSSDGCGQTFEIVATCTKSGTWTVTHDGPGTSCNPPPPPQEVCYPSEPTAGSWCDTVPDLTCTYPGSCCSTTYACVDHKWANTSPPCNPPIPVCPETQPAPGAACESACGISYDCQYGVCGGDSGVGATTATCVNGGWQLLTLDCG